VIDGATRQEAWASGVLGSGVGADDSLLVGDFDRDGHVEVMVNRGLEGIVLLEASPRAEAVAGITIGAPGEGAALPGASRVLVSALPQGEIASVELYVDGRKMSASASPPFVFSWSTNMYTTGAHVLFCSAVARDGTALTSPPVSV